MGKQGLEEIERKLRQELDAIEQATNNVRNELERHADGKKLKGDEIVGWLGEIYAKLLLNGTLVSDDLDYDVQAGDKRVSVKSRKGWGRQWNRSSAIPRLEGEGCPTHLMFLHFNDDYSLDMVWLYPWADLLRGNRFLKHIVRGNFRSFFFLVDKAKDGSYVFL